MKEVSTAKLIISYTTRLLATKVEFGWSSSKFISTVIKIEEDPMKGNYLIVKTEN